MTKILKIGMAGVLVMVLVVGVPASAAAPLRFRESVDVTFEETAFSEACGFGVAVHLVGTDTTEVFFDKDGNLAKVVETDASFTHTFINLENGNTYTSPSPASVHITVLRDGSMELAVDGLLGHIKASSGDSLRAGRTVWVAEFVGPGDIEPVGDPIFQAGGTDGAVPALCDALA